MSPIQRFTSRLLKLAYRYTHSARYRHNERLWPFMHVERDAQGAIRGLRYRGRPIALANDAALAGSRHGRCHLIASGPSIREIDYARLAPREVIGVNGAIALAARQAVRFDYYCFNDTGFVRARPDLVDQVLAQDLLLFTTPLCLAHILHRRAPETLRCRVFLIENPQWPALGAARSVDELMADDVSGAFTLFDRSLALGFSRDLRQGFFEAGTVAYIALQIAAWLGFEEIVLHGIDLRQAASVPRFYESAGERLGTTLDQYLPTHILPAFRAAAALLAPAGVRLVNLSADSALDAPICEKRDWRSLCDALGTRLEPFPGALPASVL